MIEVNSRSSRTVPFLSKITEVPMANFSDQSIRSNLKDEGQDDGLNKEGTYVKVSVFCPVNLNKELM